MNDKTAKAERRQVRRVLGEDTTKWLAAVDQALRNHERIMEANREARERLDADFHAHCLWLSGVLMPMRRLSVWGRLRWLLTGSNGNPLGHRP